MSTVAGKVQPFPNNVAMRSRTSLTCLIRQTRQGDFLWRDLCTVTSSTANASEKKRKELGSHIKETKVRMYQIHPIGNLLKLTKVLPGYVDEIIGFYKTILRTFVSPPRRHTRKGKQLFFLVLAIVGIAAIALFALGLGLVQSRSTPKAKVKEQLCRMLVICKVNCSWGSNYT